MSLIVCKVPNMSWRETVSIYARRYGLETECLEVYDECISLGMQEDQAAFCGLGEWDCLDFVDDDGEPTASVQAFSPIED